MTLPISSQILNRVRSLHRGLTLHGHVRHRLRSINPVLGSDDRHDTIDLVSILSSLVRSLRARHSLQQAIIEAGNHQSAGIIRYLAERLSSGRSLDQACAEFRAIDSTYHRRQKSGDVSALVIGVIELAHSMGGDEARLIDSLIHSLIERQHIRQERQAQATTVLSSMRMLTWLPVVCGLWIITESTSSRNFVLHTTVGRICLIAGILLNLLGRFWANRIVTPS